MRLKQKVISTAEAIAAHFNGLSQEESARAQAEKVVTPGMPELLRRAAAEGAVLLKNENILPFPKGSRVSVFGRGQTEWFYTGYGSGGDVNKPYAVDLITGLRNCADLQLNETLAEQYAKWNAENPIDHGFWGHWPRFYPEMPVSDALCAAAAEASDCAVVVIGRSSGEDRENALEKGSYYLTDEETRLLAAVTDRFDKVAVLLNIGSIMDFSWLDGFSGKIGAALLVWQGGMESGNAVADLLCGAVTPCGRLADTAALSYNLYPSAENFGGSDFNNYTEDIFVGYRWFETFQPNGVQYPFGFGLSYTKFTTKFQKLSASAQGFTVTCTVKNVGKTYTGKTSVQVYLKKPNGVLGNPARILGGFAKTKPLAPGKQQTLEIFVPRERLSSYDESGETGYPHAYVIEAGEYEFFLGGSVREAQKVGSFVQSKTESVATLREACAPRAAFEVYRAKETNGVRTAVKAPVRTARSDLKKRILHSLPKAVPMTGDKGLKLSDVLNGKATMDAFVAQLDLTELEAISRGDYTMNSALGVPGNAGAFGGVLETLREKGVPPVTTTDGPSGIRLYSCCSLLPIGTLLACTFDTALVEEVYALLGQEMRARGSDVLLGPGMNIHRNPLCGRNFEYFSEDPYLTGKIAAACVRGMQSAGVSACPKHFACNNQEFRRNRNDSRVSERALREIYLKGFEICIKEASPKSIMTSYNKINCVYAHYNYDLCTTILRGEWGYRGLVMTDWWMRPQHSPEFPQMRDNAYRVRAQVDVLMPGGSRTGKRKSDGTLLKTYGKPEGITLGEMQRSAENVLRFAMHSPAMERLKPKE